VVTRRPASPAQNNLFIVEPFSGDTIGRLFATHPPTEKRIAPLGACIQSPAQVRGAGRSAGPGGG
jgi:Zn-dependent protease with chaperone function